MLKHKISSLKAAISLVALMTLGAGPTMAQDIVIGLNMVKSGVLKTVGEATETSVDIAVEEVNAKGGIMERAERILLLGLGLLFQALLVPILWIMLVLTVATAVQRFLKVWRQASVERPVPVATRRSSRRRSTRVTSTAWRQNLQSRRRR